MIKLVWRRKCHQYIANIWLGEFSKSTAPFDFYNSPTEKSETKEGRATFILSVHNNDAHNNNKIPDVSGTYNARWRKNAKRAIPSLLILCTYDIVCLVGSQGILSETLICRTKHPDTDPEELFVISPSRRPEKLWTARKLADDNWSSSSLDRDPSAYWNSWFFRNIEEIKYYYRGRNVGKTWYLKDRTHVHKIESWNWNWRKIKIEIKRGFVVSGHVDTQ